MDTSIDDEQLGLLIFHLELNDRGLVINTENLIVGVQA
jgi:hypothetical protein